MSVVSALQAASVRLVGRKPNVFFSASTPFEQELADLINDVAIDIKDRHDWRALTEIATFVGDGTTTEFPFPGEYDRMVQGVEILDPNSWAWGYQAIPDLTEWLYRKNSGFMPIPGGWIIIGDEFNFEPAPPADRTAIFPYISKQYARDADGNRKSRFTNDSDEFLLDERLLTLGVVWRWREQKRLDTTGDQERFEASLSEAMARDKGARVIRKVWRGGRDLATRYAWPWPLGGNP